MSMALTCDMVESAVMTSCYYRPRCLLVSDGGQSVATVTSKNRRGSSPERSEYCCKL